MFTVHDFVRNPYGWEIIHAVDSAWYVIYTVYYSLFLLLSLYLIVKWHFGTGIMREKKQAAVIFATAFIATVINIVIHTVLPALDFYEVPQIAHIVTLIWIFGIWYSMVHYKLMSINSMITIDDIISHIDEIVVILDPGMKIVSANGEFMKFFPDHPGNIAGKNFIDFLCRDKELPEELEALTGGDRDPLRCKVCYRTGTEPVWSDTTITRVADRYSDLVGFLVISKVQKGKDYLQTLYKITDREFEIIVLSITGYSNSRIGEKLGITVRTVETHLTNIYNKLTIGSKIELMNLAHRYDLFRQ